MKVTIVRTIAAATAIAVVATATAQFGSGSVPTGHRHKMRPDPPRPHPQPGDDPPQFGDPVPGLDATQQQAFLDGREEFESIETPEGGLGPIFNNNSCAVCHSTPVSGGVSSITVTRFGRSLHGGFDALESLGGSLLQQFAIDPVALEKVPDEANVVAQRLTTPLFGAGLLEAITDDDIRANAARAQGDGITGRAASITDPSTGQARIGRLGWKAQHATVLGFAADAYLNEMGVTNRFFPDENAPNGDAARLARVLTTTGINDPADPVTGRSDIDASADFIRLLAPPSQLPLSASARSGQRLFDSINCTGCHTPSMTSGASPVAALAHKTVPLYSDLLLHNMGQLADGIGQGDARPHEMKTAPLWGLRARTQFLHDGRAHSVDEAIRAHAGEASAARDRYRQLSDSDEHDLLEFLSSI